MARLLMQSADAEYRVISLKLGVNRVGRGADNDIQIEHPTLSTQHCELHWIDEKVRVLDSNSTNGVFVNGQPTTEAFLEAGQILRLGSVELYVESVTAEISIPDVPAEMQVSSVERPDGLWTCARHPEALGEFRCAHCESLWCLSCIHRLKHSGSRRTLRLCPKCSRKVEYIGERAASRGRGVLAFLAKTLRLPFRRKRTFHKPDE